VFSTFRAATCEGKWWLPKNILIADSSGPTRLATRRALECQPGLEVCAEAVDGLDAVEKARELNPDLIILALGMPRLNGFDVARKLRAMSIEVPIILFTFYADAIPPQDAQVAGITAVVCKTDPQALKQHIEKLLAA
jgi:two-component system response regulator EvgA